MSFHIRRRLAKWGGSYALLATEASVDTAVVFVHGFNGASDSTWLHFQTLIDRCDDDFQHWRTSDVFFWEYASVTSPLRASSNRLGRFLNELFPTPPESLFRIDLNPALLSIGLSDDVIIRENFAGYQRLVLVGHSEGAVVIRLLVRDRIASFLAAEEEALRKSATQVVAHDNREEIRAGKQVQRQLSEVAAVRDRIRRELLQSNVDFSILNSRLCLFAPAHCGSTITGSWGVLLESPGIATIAKAVMRWSTAQVDLLPTSGVLQALRHETERYAENNAWIAALRARILWGAEERVVTMDRYQFDVDEIVPDQNHSSICKPMFEYTYPLAFVSYEQATRRATH